MIEVERLTKQYRSLVAVRDLTFKVGRGTVVGLLGLNGAGKTTTLRLLSGVLGPTDGMVRLCGYDLIRQPLEARRCLGYLPETSPLYPELTVRQYLSYRIELKGIARSRQRANLMDAANKAGCDDVLDVPIRRLSKGHRQRVGIADVLSANPPILLLDEPTAGLDPIQVRQLRDLVVQLREEHAIIVSTHVLADVDAICTHALVMHKGRLVADESISALQTRYDGGQVELQLTDPQNRSLAILSSLGWNVCDDVSPCSLSLRPTEAPATSTVCARLAARCPNVEAEIERLVAALIEVGVGVRRVTRASTNLDSVLTALTHAESNE